MYLSLTVTYTEVSGQFAPTIFDVSRVKKHLDGFSPGTIAALIDLFLREIEIMHRRRLVAIFFFAVLAVAVLWFWRRRSQPPNAAPAAVENTTEQSASAQRPSTSDTSIHAHNLLLRKGPNLHIYVQWLDGRLTRARRDLNPSFDNPDSFDLNIDNGVIRINIGDIGHYIDSSVSGSPLSNVTLLADGPNLKLTGTLHKLVSVPVQVIASLSVLPDDRVRVHITKIDVLKLPLKGLLGLFHVTAADLVKTNIAGVEVQGNDLLLDTHTLLPPPHIRGRLMQLSVVSPDVQAVYGNGVEKVQNVELWRNFFSMNGGTIDFGSLSMHPVKIMMIDISSNPWFDLDLVNYRQQFASGYTRMTDDGGLQMFIPDMRDVPAKPVPQNDSIQWFKDRNIPPPSQITASVSH